MKKFILVALLFIHLGAFAQSRFKYELDFKIDSTNKNFIQKEVFNLDYLNGKSLFYSEALAQLDSIRSAGSSLNKKDIPEPKLDYVVSYDSQTAILQFWDTVGSSILQTTDPRKIKWTITSETETINKYKVQKAYTKFGGRSWTAWFTTDISIAEGPYKFKGLPGLIIKIFDAEQDYVFELIQIQKLNNLYNFKSFEKLGIPIVTVDFNKYVEAKKVFLENPETMILNQPGFSQMQIPPEDLKYMIDALKARQKKYNNTIELSLKN